MKTQLHRAARWYALHEWHVFPLRPQTKEPFAKLGVYNATTDLAVIDTWWQRWPQANVGIHCGASGILALDLDQYKDGYRGDTLLTFEDQETVTNLTGGGGTHLLYGMPQGRQYGNGTGALPDGIDIRGHGGYIVVPPSIHPNGNAYHWELSYGPHEIGVRCLPQTLDAILHRASGNRRTLADIPTDNEALAIAVMIVEAALQHAGIDHRGREEYGSGRRWILTECPFNSPTDPHPNDRAAYVIVLPDGRISAGCHHQRCRTNLRNAHMTGWQHIKHLGAMQHERQSA